MRLLSRRLRRRHGATACSTSTRRCCPLFPGPAHARARARRRREDCTARRSTSSAPRWIPARSSRRARCRSARTTRPETLAARVLAVEHRLYPAGAAARGERGGQSRRRPRRRSGDGAGAKRRCLSPTRLAGLRGAKHACVPDQRKEQDERHALMRKRQPDRHDMDAASRCRAPAARAREPPSATRAVARADSPLRAIAIA